MLWPIIVSEDFSLDELYIPIENLVFALTESVT